MKRACRLFACAVLASLLGGCAADQAARMIQYPLRSPEFVDWELGHNRFLLGQWNRSYASDEGYITRFYDRNTGVVARVPGDVLRYRRNGDSRIVGAVRYDSDSPMQVVLFERRVTGYNPWCELHAPAREGVRPYTLCGYIGLFLSLDGGRSFVWRRVSIPTPAGRSSIDYDQFEFAIVRRNTLYLGLYTNGWHLPEDDGSCRHAGCPTYARRFDGPAIVRDNARALFVLATPLPGGGAPLPAAQIPADLPLDYVAGQALLDFDAGQPMQRITTVPRRLAPPAGREDTRAAWQASIAAYRLDYPEWAAHQLQEDAERRRFYAATPDEAARMAWERARPDYPVAWVRFNEYVTDDKGVYRWE